MIRSPASRLPILSPRPRAAALAIALLLASELTAQYDDVFDTSGRSFPQTKRPAGRQLPRLPLFFPPDPPPLDRVINRGVPHGSSRPPAPPELAPHINETFYPALGTRLLTDSLRGSLLRQLEAYRAAKLTLREELRAELLRLSEADPETRLAALTGLAARQTPKIAELEKNAEKLRRDLVMSEHAWNAQREWRLNDREQRGFSPIEIAQVMRAYAFYQNGLLPAQRRLLREIAMELLLAVDDPAKATDAQPYIFFLPEPARVVFPANMSADAAAKLAVYQTKKSQLKKELYDAVYEHDGNTLGFLRGNTLSALAGKQASRIAELEALAEDVRRALPPESAVPPAPARAALPRFLAIRVSAMTTKYTAMQQDATARIDRVIARTKGLPLQAVYRFEPDGLKFIVAPTRNGRRRPDLRKRIETIHSEISAVADDYGQKLADLLNERSAICDEIGEALGLADRQAIEAALHSAMLAAAQKETAASYAEYRVAVFEPGLSPEQRRLLFDAAIEHLELPLPRGELPPTRRNNAW